MNEVIKGLPVIALKGMTILPYMVIHFDINRKNLIETVEYAMLHGQKIFITGYAGDEQQEDGMEEQLRETGTVCEIKQIMKLPGSVLRVMVRGMERGKSLSYNFDGKIMFANVEISDAEGMDELLTAAYAREIKELARAYAAVNPRLNKEIMGRIMAADDISELIYRIIAEFPFENGIKIALYDCDDIIERCNRIREAISREIEDRKSTRLNSSH